MYQLPFLILWITFQATVVAWLFLGRHKECLFTPDRTLTNQRIDSIQGQLGEELSLCRSLIGTWHLKSNCIMRKCHHRMDEDAQKLHRRVLTSSQASISYTLALLKTTHSWGAGEHVARIPGEGLETFFSSHKENANRPITVTKYLGSIVLFCLLYCRVNLQSFSPPWGTCLQECDWQRWRQ